jgi:ankyrin repeat protein
MLTYIRKETGKNMEFIIDDINKNPQKYEIYFKKFAISALAIVGILSYIQYNKNIKNIKNAINSRDLKFVKKYINEANVNNINEIGNTALMNACEKAYLDIVKYLLSIENISINIQNNEGKSALMLACVNCNCQIIDKLLENTSIDITLQDKDGMTALMYLIKANDTIKNRNCYYIFEKLINKNINILNTEDNKRKTALIYAVESADLDFMRLISGIKRKLKMDTKDIDDVIKVAEENKKSEGVGRKYTQILEILSPAKEKVIPLLSSLNNKGVDANIINILEFLDPATFVNNQKTLETKIECEPSEPSE